MKKFILPITMGLALAASASAQVTINEVRIDQPGGDNDEFFELTGAPGTSLDGLTYIVIGDSSAGGSGVGYGGGLDAIVDLTGSVIGPSGYFLVGESSMTIATPDLVESLGFENSDNVTHMVVTDFTGTTADDLDADDDGVLDFTPWTSIVDSVAFVENLANGELVYSANQVGPDGTYVPGHISLIAGVWVINDFGIGYEDTPGNPNVSATGTAFCDPAALNSTGGYASLTGFIGSGAGSGLHLEVNNGPASEFGYFLVGNMAVDPGTAVSNGNLCLVGAAGSAFYRYNIAGTSSNSIGQFDANGILMNVVGTSATGAGFDVPATIPASPPITIMAGDTWHFQFWYRDTAAAVGSSNFSNGLTVSF